jgi:hypothetical protein
MVRHHKKTKKHSRRRRMRGGVWYNPLTWGKTEAPASATGLPPVVDKAASDVSSGLTDATKTVADGVGVPSASTQAAVVGAPAGSAGILGSDASMGGRRRRRTRKHRKTRKH